MRQDPVKSGPAQLNCHVTMEIAKMNNIYWFLKSRALTSSYISPEKNNRSSNKTYNLV